MLLLQHVKCRICRCILKCTANNFVFPNLEDFLTKPAAAKSDTAYGTGNTTGNTEFEENSQQIK